MITEIDKGISVIRDLFCLVDNVITGAQLCLIFFVCVCGPLFLAGGVGSGLFVCFVSVLLLLLDLWEVFKVVAVNRGSSGALNCFLFLVFCFYL